MTNFPEIIIIISVVNHTAHKRKYRGIAKLVRHWILNPACVGSSPATPAIELSAVPTGAAFLLPKILNSVQGSCQSVSAIRQWAERQCQCRHARATIRALHWHRLFRPSQSLLIATIPNSSPPASRLPCSSSTLHEQHIQLRK